MMTARHCSFDQDSAPGGISPPRTRQFQYPAQWLEYLSGDSFVKMDLMYRQVM